MPVHSYNVITAHAHAYEYIALKHLVDVMGYVTDVYLPRSGVYDPATREGSVYGYKDDEYRYPDTPDMQIRIAYLDPQEEMAVRGPDMLVNQENTAYTLSPDVQVHSKLLVNYGGQDLSYFVKSIETLRNPNATSTDDESLIKLTLTIHV